MDSVNWIGIGLAALIVVGAVCMLGIIVVVVFRSVATLRRYGGRAGAVYEARVGHTYGTLDLKPDTRLVEQRMKIVAVEHPDQTVGLEIRTVVKSYGRVRDVLQAARLNPSEALRLASALEAEARR